MLSTYVELKTGGSELWRSEYDQVQAIRQLYPVIRKQKGFVEMECTEQTQPHEVLAHLLIQLGKINCAKKVEFGYTMGLRVNRDCNGFHLAEPIEYPQKECPERLHIIQLKTMPLIESHYPALHDALCLMFSLLHHKCGVLIMEDEAHGGHVYEMLEQDAEQYENEMDEEEFETSFKSLQRLYGTDGDAGILKSILSREYVPKLNNGPCSIDTLESIVKQMRPRTPLTKKFKKWMEMGVELLCMNRRIDDFCYQPLEAFDRFDDYHPIQMDYCFRLMWDSSDTMAQMFYDHLDVDAGEYGSLPLFYVIKHQAGNRVTEKHRFPNLIHEFFDEGDDLMVEIGKQILNKQNELKKKRSRKGRLINILL